MENFTFSCDVILLYKFNLGVLMCFNETIRYKKQAQEYLQTFAR